MNINRYTLQHSIIGTYLNCDAKRKLNKIAQTIMHRLMHHDPFLTPYHPLTRTDIIVHISTILYNLKTQLKSE